MTATAPARYVSSNLALAIMFAGVAAFLAEPGTGAELFGWFAVGVAVGVGNWLWLRHRRRRRAARLGGNARIVAVGMGVVVVAGARVFFGEGFVPVLMAFGAGAVLIGAYPVKRP